MNIRHPCRDASQKLKKIRAPKQSFCADLGGGYPNGAPGLEIAFPWQLQAGGNRPALLTRHRLGALSGQRDLLVLVTNEADYRTNIRAFALRAVVRVNSKSGVEFGIALAAIETSRIRLQRVFGAVFFTSAQEESNECESQP